VYVKLQVDLKKKRDETVVTEWDLSGLERKVKNTFKVRGEVYGVQSPPISSLSGTTDIMEIVVHVTNCGKN
jgi:hypothetical protein